MPDKITISTFRNSSSCFPTKKPPENTLRRALWANGVHCQMRRIGDRITTRKNGFYRCNPCKLDFTVRTGTIFGRSRIPLHKWLSAMYLLLTARKGISSLGLVQGNRHPATAWFMPAESVRTWQRSFRVGRHRVNQRNLYRRQGSKQTSSRKFRAGRSAVGKTAGSLRDA